MKIARGHQVLPSNKQLEADNVKADWAFAIQAYGAGEREYLESLMHTHAPAQWPPEVGSFLADIVAGIRKVNQPGKKSALALRDREHIASVMARFRAMLNLGSDAEVAASYNAAHGSDLIDARDVRRDKHKRIAGAIMSLAKKHGVTEAVIKKVAARLP